MDVLVRAAENHLAEPSDGRCYYDDLRGRSQGSLIDIGRLMAGTLTPEMRNNRNHKIHHIT